VDSVSPHPEKLKKKQYKAILGLGSVWLKIGNPQHLDLKALHDAYEIGEVGLPLYHEHSG
jgi:hypothetical protein